jgi:hypothetical protein
VNTTITILERRMRNIILKIMMMMNMMLTITTITNTDLRKKYLNPLISHTRRVPSGERCKTYLSFQDPTSIDPLF